MQDGFDTECFPGRRGLRATPRNNLGWGLMADGAAPGNIHDVLATSEGIDRAFASPEMISVIPCRTIFSGGRIIRREERFDAWLGQG